MSNASNNTHFRNFGRLAIGAGFGLLLSVTAQAASLKSCDPGAFERLREETLVPLFEALRAGDLSEIQRHMSPNRAAEYAVLFEQNAGYGQFLRDYYADSSFEIIDVQGKGRDFTALVMIYWSDGRTAEVELQFDRAKGDLAAAVAPGRQCGSAP